MSEERVQRVAVKARSAAAPVGTAHICHADPEHGLRLTPQAWTTAAGALLGGLDLAQGLGVMPRYAESVFRPIRLLQQAGGGFSARQQALPTLWDTWQAPNAADRLQSLRSQHTTPWRTA